MKISLGVSSTGLRKRAAAYLTSKERIEPDNEKPADIDSAPDTLIRLVISEIERDIRAVEKTFQRSDVDGFQHLTDLWFKYHLLADYQEKHGNRPDRVLRMWQPRTVC